ncbi:Protein of unknown function (DUF3048) [Isoptericola jiangsuensis]|uniref:DUF3048 family protein n=1 Tax=Isoptericola jiangsuensis TaxID=548579 RepID=A0A2A9EV03_9MICO|nr:DUF3048 domain-containing protein [Isoptericola jiangsuensis]PFG42110.1 Protein of unknown function (DUF3048) [Isoptericola jiangsuensis]
MTVRRRPAALAGTLLAVTLLAACSGEPEPAPTSTVAAPVESVAKSAPPAVPTVWPLTGVATDEVAQRPALAIKIENSREARPQTGLEAADTVWEEVVEGGITRFVAVYHSTVPDVVEPVRSVRPMDPAIVAPLDGILAYSGAQQPFIDAVGAAGVQSVIMDAGDAGFTRDPNRYAPHNVLGDPVAFLAQDDGERTTPPPAQFAFARAAAHATAVVQGTATRHLDVVLSPAQTSAWAWEKKSGTWLRSEGTAPSLSTSGVQHAAENVVVLDVEVVDTSYRDPSGAPVPETQLVGSGTGLVASGGRTLAVEWSKKSLHDPVVLTADGDPVELAPGRTWVELVPTRTGSYSTS